MNRRAFSDVNEISNFLEATDTGIKKDPPAMLCSHNFHFGSNSSSGMPLNKQVNLPKNTSKIKNLLSSFPGLAIVIMAKNRTVMTQTGN